MSLSMLIRQNERGEPVVSETRSTVADLVRAAHEDGIESVRGIASQMRSVNSLDDHDLELILTYCAEQRCRDDKVTCAGCRRHTSARGLQSLDDYVDYFAQVVVSNGSRSLIGSGRETVEVESLEWLSRHWAGEEYWFWARRVLRKLRYGLRRKHQSIGQAEISIAAPVIILVEPQIPENIGMVARAMGNFGLDELRVVGPRDGWPNEKARAVASGAAAIIDDARLFQTVPEALADLNWVAATTARQRDMRKPVMTPETASQTLLEVASRDARCGILFGRERNGLNSDEIAMADAAVMIPVNSQFASLNLAQSVLLLGYEWLRATGIGSMGRVTRNEKAIQPGVPLGGGRLATKQELFNLFEHLEEELRMRGYFNPSHRRSVVTRNIRTMLTRMEATDQEVRTLRGIVATLAKRKPGENDESR